jgi:hypothetical protein
MLARLLSGLAVDLLQLGAQAGVFLQQPRDLLIRRSVT